jgi:hypothetical protein
VADRRKCLFRPLGHALSIFEAGVRASDPRATCYLITSLFEGDFRRESALPSSKFADLASEEVILAKTADRSFA